MILEKIHETYMEKMKKPSTMNIINSWIDYKKEVTIYDYLQDEYLKSFTVENLIKLKTDLINCIFLHDSEKLHNTALSWMIDKELYEDLEKVSSKYYSKFNEKLEKQSTLNTNQVSLVYKYLLKTKEYRRLIHFLAALINCNTSEPESRIKGELSIKERLIYADITLSAINEIEKTLSTTQELETVRKGVEKFKNVLIIQSNIENVLIKVQKENLSPADNKRFADNVKLLNTQIFTYDTLIEKITKPMKLYDITINLLYHKVLEEGKVTNETAIEVESCY